MKLYRRDAHSDNQQISYYLKGALVSLLLDLHLLARGQGLHVLLQQLWQRLVKQAGATARPMLSNWLESLIRNCPHCCRAGSLAWTIYRSLAI